MSHYNWSINWKTTTVDYEQKINKKEDEIIDLKKKIDDMSNEFARMLRVFFYIL